MEDNFPPLMKLSPFYDQKVWGGEFLKKLKGIACNFPVGETHEISTLDGENSTYGDIPISNFVGSLSYVVKLIETTDNLSVQVHPNDTYAKTVENSSGKSECWLILNSLAGGGIYLGFKPGVKRQDLEKAIKNNDTVNELLNFYPVKRGDFFFVPAGIQHKQHK